MNRVVFIRGTSGSGKSTLVRKVLGKSPEVVETTPTGRSLVYRVGSVYILGSYSKTGGGADGIGTDQELVSLCLKYQKRGTVLFEKMMLVNYHGAVGRALEAVPHVCAFMDTPFEVCAARVNDRRAKRGQPPLKSTENIRSKHAGMWRLYHRFLISPPRNAAVVKLNYRRAYADLMEVLNEK